MPGDLAGIQRALNKVLDEGRRFAETVTKQLTHPENVRVDVSVSGIRMGKPFLLFAPIPLGKPKTHAIDRTRSPRWRAGSKRTKKLARLARRAGRRTPFENPWKGWESLGWTTDSEADTVHHG
jgi:hypothetical protein